MNINTKLQSSDILKKEFRTKNFGGYNPDEVDSYLDDIIQDYEGMENYIKQLEEENSSLRQDMLDKPQTTATETVAATPESSFDNTVIATATPSEQSIYDAPAASEEVKTTDQPYSPVDESYPTTTNYDILRRLSNLERKVFGEEKTTTESAQSFYGDETQD